MEKAAELEKARGPKPTEVAKRQNILPGIRREYIQVLHNKARDLRRR